MKRLIIIDDTTCKEELESFLETNPQNIQLLLSEQDYNVDLEQLVSQIKTTFQDKKTIVFITDEQVIKVAKEDLLFITNRQRFTELFLSNGNSYKLPETFQYYSQKLENHTITKINQNVIINIKSIQRFVYPQNIVYLNGNHRFIVERMYQEKLMNLLNNLESIH